MGLIDRIFGDSRSPAPLSRPAAESKTPPGSPKALHRELLRVALRDTLVRHGIPIQWITAETLPMPVNATEMGLHLRLLIRHHDPRLLAHALALQTSLIKRVELLDPNSALWLMGISWQFALLTQPALLDMPDPAEWANPLPAASSCQSAPVAVRTGGQRPADDDAFQATERTPL